MKESPAVQMPGRNHIVPDNRTGGATFADRTSPLTQI